MRIPVVLSCSIVQYFCSAPHPNSNRPSYRLIHPATTSALISEQALKRALLLLAATDAQLAAQQATQILMDSMPKYTELSSPLSPIMQTLDPAATVHADAASLPDSGTTSLADASSSSDVGAESQAGARGSPGSMPSAGSSPAVSVTSFGGNNQLQGQPVWLSDVILGSRVQFLMSMLAPCLATLPKVGSSLMSLASELLVSAIRQCIVHSTCQSLVVALELVKFTMVLWGG